ncbi:MAG: hypothetical protein ACKO3D_00560 [Actinomycetota bacterium]
MRIGQDRHLVLDFLADEMERIWSSFDRARDKEPEVTNEMSELLAAKLPRHASEILSVLRESMDAARLHRVGRGLKTLSAHQPD